MLFLKPGGQLISKLNSYQDFPGVHPDVVAPPQKEFVLSWDKRAHVKILLKHLADHFSGD
jgi:hypothetical protein